MNLPTSSRAAAPSPVSLRDIFNIARKHVLLVLVCWIAVVAIVLFWTLGQAKIYRAEVLLRLDPDPPRPLGQKVEVVGREASSYWNRREFYESEYRIMKSMRLCVAVVRSLGLNADPSFVGVRQSKQAGWKPISVDEAAELLAKRLIVEPLKESSLVYYRYEDTDPKRTQLILNTVVRTYLAQNLENTSRISTYASEWLNGQLDHLKSDLETSERALNDFRQKNNVLSISLEDQHNILATQLDEVAKQTTSLQIKRAELRARCTQLESVKPTDPSQAGSTELLSSTVLSMLRQQYAEQMRNYEELASTLDQSHPKMLAATGRIEAVKKAIKSEIENIKGAVGRDLKSVDMQASSLKKQYEELQQQAHTLQSFEITYNQLNRTKANNEKIYGIVLERAHETDLTRMMNFNNIQVVDEAMEPKIPVRPNVPVNMLMGVLAGFLLGVGAALVREFSDRSIKTPADIDEYVGITCLGLLPEIAKSGVAEYARKVKTTETGTVLALSDRDLIVSQSPLGSVAEAARVVRTNLTFMSPDKPYAAVLVTSAIPQEGKTTVVCSLSTVFAQTGLRVLVIDTDLRRPRLHRTFRISNDVGVSLVVTGQAPLDECIRESGIPNVWVLTSGPIPPNPAELLESHRFRDLVETLKSKFDRIVFDSPPVLPVTDAAILSRLVDCVVVVVRAFRTDKYAVRQAVKQLLGVKGHLAGIVLNDVNLSRAEYGKYSEYHYYHSRNYSANPAEPALKPPDRRQDEPPADRPTH